MYKKVRIICGIIFLLAAVIGGYFLIRKNGFFEKKKVLDIKSSIVSELEQNSQPEIITGNQQEQEKVTDNQESASNISENIDVKQKEVSPVEKTISTGQVETSKKTDQKSETGKIVEKFVSWGFQKSSSRTIKAIIIHTTYNALGGDRFDFSKVMQEWKDAGVSPHYAIDRDGTIYHLVADQNIAWHAGASKLPDGTTDVNGVSIGIEVVNSKDAKFTDEQYLAINSLLASLKKKYDIKYILGHDEISPGRKTDPWNIDWKKVNR